MRKHYDFSNAKPNPYSKLLKKSVTIRLDEPTLAYFKSLSQEMAIPYQTLINLYLRECAASQKHLRLAWESPHEPKSA
ncbi:BrnA antitoxin family protein [Holophaga foetida]|uniref:BrnA antitoxin family protein n=1 Tax=Holophaga foetida TaxID=35839 RepID=UPI0002473767|nr:BrnA antitoxin family protein [Holophaga foetida]